jgi:hypothetical protein
VLSLRVIGAYKVREATVVTCAVSSWPVSMRLTLDSEQLGVLSDLEKRQLPTVTADPGRGWVE